VSTLSIAAFVVSDLVLVLASGIERSRVEWIDRNDGPEVVGRLVVRRGADALLVAGTLAAALACSGAIVAMLAAAGAGYITWIGMTALVVADQISETPPRGQPTHSGATSNGSEPRPFLLLLSLVSQFANGHGPLDFAAQAGLLGCLHIVTCGAVRAGAGMVGGRNGFWLPTRVVVTRVIGGLIILVGYLLVVSRLAY
jgi:threonine/homoserine/homoserine lactone efflux protein